MIEIPKAVQDQIDAMKATIDKLLTKVDSGTARSVQQESEAKLQAIRKKSLFQGLGEQPPGKVGTGNYPFALYKKSTQMVPATDEKGNLKRDPAGQIILTPALDKRGDPLVDRTEATSDDHKAELIADGWCVNPLGVPYEDESEDAAPETGGTGRKRGRPRKVITEASE